MKTVTLLAKVVDGRIDPDSERNWETAMKILEGKQVSIKIGPRTRVRSNLQNNYLWGVVYKTISDETGNDSKDLHEYFKEKFISTIVYRTMHKPDGTSEVIDFRQTRSTTDLTTVEFIEYYRGIIAFAAEDLGIYVPEPNEEEMWQLMKMVEEEEKRRKM